MDLVERIKEKLAGHITPRGFDELIGAELKEVAQLEAENEAYDTLATERDNYKTLIETLIGNIDTLFDAYPDKMPLEDAMRHWQRYARKRHTSGYKTLKRKLADAICRCH